VARRVSGATGFASVRSATWTIDSVLAEPVAHSKETDNLFSSRFSLRQKLAFDDAGQARDGAFSTQIRLAKEPVRERNPPSAMLEPMIHEDRRESP